MRYFLGSMIVVFIVTINCFLRKIRQIFSNQNFSLTQFSQKFREINLLTNNYLRPIQIRIIHILNWFHEMAFKIPKVIFCFYHTVKHFERLPRKKCTLWCKIPISGSLRKFLEYFQVPTKSIAFSTLRNTVVFKLQCKIQISRQR